jgi:predicted O-methyltransferase YrrM
MMDVSEYYESAVRRHSIKDQAIYDDACVPLPRRKETTPYHSGPHSVRMLRMAYELAGRPANVLEIGFCLGHSASLWLNLGARHVTSIDNSTRPETLAASNILRAIYGGDRFTFILRDNMNPTDFVRKNTGLIFIDGDHGVEGVDTDTAWALELGIPFILFDDFFKKWADGTQPAIEKHGLIPLAIIGTMALCVPGKDFL